MPPPARALPCSEQPLPRRLCPSMLLAPRRDRAGAPNRSARLAPQHASPHSTPPPRRPQHNQRRHGGLPDLARVAGWAAFRPAGNPPRHAPGCARGIPRQGLLRKEVSKPPGQRDEELVHKLSAEFYTLQLANAKARLCATAAPLPLPPPPLLLAPPLAAAARGLRALLTCIAVHTAFA